METYREDDIYLPEISPPPSPAVERGCPTCPVIADAKVYMGRESDMKKDGFEFVHVCCGCITVQYEEKTKRSRITVSDLDDPAGTHILDTFVTHRAWISGPDQVGMWLVPHNSDRLAYLFVFRCAEQARDFVAQVNHILQNDNTVKDNERKEEQAVRNLFRSKRPQTKGPKSPVLRAVYRTLSILWI